MSILEAAAAFSAAVNSSTYEERNAAVITLRQNSRDAQTPEDQITWWDLAEAVHASGSEWPYAV